MEELTRTQICNLYYVQKMPIKQVARLVAYTPKTVRTVLRGEGVYVPPPLRPAAYCAIDYRSCSVCSALFIGRPSDGGHRKTCSTPCAAEHRRRIGNARKRNREHAERGAFSDITPEQELAMRRKARKCPMCGVRLTDKRGLPNSKHLDHIIPICVGGTHSHGNVRIVCAADNLRRPKDGSDYAGPVTLWAQGPSPVRRPHGGANKTTCRKGLHPWVAENIKVVSGKRVCAACREELDRKKYPRRPCAKCRTLAPLRFGTAMCPECTLAAVRAAACLRMAGELSWAEIAAQVGYGTAEGIRTAVKHAAPDAWAALAAIPKAARVKPGRRCQCGAPVPPGSRGMNHSRCDACVQSAAHRAVQLRAQGWTLRKIADELGCASITTVTNLMKTVMPIESRMGRPAKTP